MLIKKTIVGSLLALSCAISTPIFSHDINHSSTNQTCWCHKNMSEVVNSLQLSDAQKGKIKLIKQQMHDNRDKTKQEMKTLESQIHHLAMAPTLDEKKLDVILDQKVALIKKRMMHKIMMQHQIYTVLTPSQQQKFQQRMTNKK